MNRCGGERFLRCVRNDTDTVIIRGGQGNCKEAKREIQKEKIPEYRDRNAEKGD